MRTRRWTPLALFLAFGFAASGCMAAHGSSYRSASYGHSSRTATPYDHGRYTSTPEYRRIHRDADRYADFLDRELHLSGRQERDIERLLRDRTRDLLRHTRVRDHYHVYPFPRQNRTRAARSWWDRTDRYIERMLRPHQRNEYRFIVRALENHSGYSPRDRGRSYYYDWDGDRGR